MVVVVHSTALESKQFHLRKSPTLISSTRPENDCVCCSFHFILRNKK